MRGELELSRWGWGCHRCEAGRTDLENMLQEWRGRGRGGEEAGGVLGWWDVKWLMTVVSQRSSTLATVETIGHGDGDGDGRLRLEQLV